MWTTHPTLSAARSASTSGLIEWWIDILFGSSSLVLNLQPQTLRPRRLFGWMMEWFTVVAAALVSHCGELLMEWFTVECCCCRFIESLWWIINGVVYCWMLLLQVQWVTVVNYWWSGLLLDVVAAGLLSHCCELLMEWFTVESCYCRFIESLLWITDGVVYCWILLLQVHWVTVLLMEWFTVECCCCRLVSHCCELLMEWLLLNVVAAGLLSHCCELLMEWFTVQSCCCRFSESLLWITDGVVLLFTVIAAGSISHCYELLMEWFTVHCVTGPRKGGRKEGTQTQTLRWIIGVYL